uniref:DUF5709 domain-containing protein n=1 Tax=Heterorhabditis bacteriophora TaxID=37862 RepID=A0A1I7XGU5_HETBA
MADGEELDAETAQQLATSLADGELMIDDPTQIVDRFDDDDDDPYGHLAEGRELNTVEGDNQSLSSNDESRLKDQSEAHHIGSHPHVCSS